MKGLKYTFLFVLLLPFSVPAQKSNPTPDFTPVTDTASYHDFIYTTEDKLLLDKQLNDINAELEKTKKRINSLKLYVNDLKSYQMQVAQLNFHGTFDQGYAADIDKLKLNTAETDLLDNVFKMQYKGYTDYSDVSSDEVYNDILGTVDLVRMIGQKLDAYTSNADFRNLDAAHNFRFRSPYYFSDGNSDETSYCAGHPDRYNSIKTLRDSLMSAQRAISGIINKEELRIQAEIDLQQVLSKKFKDLRTGIYNKLEEKTEQLSILAIEKGIPWFSITIAILFIVPLIIRFYDGRKGSEFNDNSQRVMLAIGTVFLLTTSIMILGLAGQLSKEVLGTLIGGISAYVLNNISAERKAQVPVKAHHKATEPENEKEKEK